MDFTSLKKNLIQKGYEVVECSNKQEVQEYFKGRIINHTIGIGGSRTIEELELLPILMEGNTVYWHDHKPEELSVVETRIKAMQSEIYFSSVNGISEDGTIINIDRTGNRVAALSYGPQQVYFVVGENKVEENFEKAMHRARNVAGPLNAQRLHVNTPCAIKGDKCYDCQSIERLCRNFSIFTQKPGKDCIYTVVLVHESLGF